MIELIAEHPLTALFCSALLAGALSIALTRLPGAALRAFRRRRWERQTRRRGR